MTGYELSRDWFDFCFENPEKISPNHSAIFFFAIEHCNRLGWKIKFGFPTQMAMDAIGIKKHETYIRYFNDLCDWGFLTLIQRSVNQYSSNIISLSNGNTKNGKALGKAIQKHSAKQTDPNGESTGESNRSIDKPDNLEPYNLEQLYVLPEASTPKTNYQVFTDMYFEWYEKEVGMKPVFNGAQGKGMKAIISHLEKNAKEKQLDNDTGVIGAWAYILMNWGNLKPFEKGQKNITQISSNFNNILDQLRNGTTKDKNGNKYANSEWD